MINGRQFKVCGLTRLQDAEAAAEAGADYLGFIFYPKSPRAISLPTFAELCPNLPSLTRVAVTVEPDLEFLEDLKGAGFRDFQIHFRADSTDRDSLARWKESVGDGNLWLAPKRVPGAPFDPMWLEYGDGILWDAYDRKAFGGTGKTSDWEAFRVQSQERPEHQWVLAGGLAPENLAAAVEATGSSLYDLNSGLESSPGIKDPQRVAGVGKVLRNLA